MKRGVAQIYVILVGMYESNHSANASITQNTNNHFNLVCQLHQGHQHNSI